MKQIKFYFIAALLFVLLIELICRAIIFQNPFIGVSILINRLDVPPIYSGVAGAIDPSVPLIGDLPPKTDQYSIDNPERPYRITSNNIGARKSRNIQIPKPANLYRIFCVGDSFTFGPYLSGDDTYPELLELMLNDDKAAEVKYETVNLGMNGYYLNQEADLIMNGSKAAAPDLVILQLLDNDVPGYANAHQYQFPRIKHETGRLRRIYSFLARNVAVVRILRESVFQYIVWREGAVINQTGTKGGKGADQGGNIASPDAQYDKFIESSWFDKRRSEELADYKKQNEHDFENLVKFTRANKIRLLAVLFPTQRTIGWHRSKNDPVGAYYEELTRKYNVEFVDLNSHFAKEEDAKYYFLWPWNGHPGLRGNEYIARILADKIAAGNDKGNK
ncbi:MAG: hypothetical protein HZB29_13100 [Nitrospinae bacterium]|nr:hypothetical protein [Nitrospinota bacterium]